MEKVMGFLSMAAEELAKFQGLQGATAGVVLVIGILNCFLGYRLLKAWIALAGSYMGVLLSYTLASYYTADSLIQIGAVLGGGLLMGLAAFHIYKLGVFLLCTNISTVVLSVLLQPQSSLKFMLCLVIGILIGLLGMAFVKPIVIIHTALGGGFSTAAAAAILLEKETDMKTLIFGAVLTVAGVVIQAIFSKDQDKEKEK